MYVGGEGCVGACVGGEGYVHSVMSGLLAAAHAHGSTQWIV